MIAKILPAKFYAILKKATFFQKNEKKVKDLPDKSHIPLKHQKIV